MLNSIKMKLVFSNKKVLIFFALLTALVVAISFSAIKTHLALKNILKFQTNLASKNAQQAILLPKILNTITFNSVSTFRIWQISLEEIILVDQLSSEMSSFASQILDNEAKNKDDFSSKILLVNKKAKILLDEIDNSFLIKRFLSQENQRVLTQIKNINQDFDQLLDHFTNQETTYIIILQNTHEIRATGGFMGSYAKLELENGHIKNLHIEDIYQPAGQFTGFIEAPTGVDKFLSSGKGLALTDANWHPDFPTSAQTVLNFFALGKEQKIDGLIAINLNTIENLLKITGEIYLPDYDQTISHDNFAEIARADREDFFPGSRQKQNFLNSALTNILLTVKNLEQSRQKQIINQFLSEIPHKNIQFFSTNPIIQGLYQKYNLSGEMSDHDNNYIFLVESNVGINKANKNLLREIEIMIEEKKTFLSIVFSNKNTFLTKNKQANPDLAEADHLDYINYQRLILSPNYKVEKITQDNQKIDEWDEEIIENNKKQAFKQIGFIITVPEQTTSKIEIELSSSDPFALNPNLTIQKQSGLPATPYSIIYKNKNNNFLLEKDEIIRF